ncbi:hypothetical protein HYDPIDRAFT_113137 [Hydnomerulius pinastri MD-312]|uniref:Phospholipase/carboxylesterase/thioesterase domain-containing protein n=1 Tax=Hydnomerulius pinastri MD-312 TaxID=994086 RepID=A0A0C9WE63_9AGAM|nr:hypothetical protein HYDPIDRAFT_113137 [Hydnomerulius pinastri MD-312]
MTDIHLREDSSGSSSPRTKKTPTTSNIPLTFTYTPSDDGTDENLLILLHGLGDTHVPFAKLGRSLNLPQTAVLSLRAPEQIPFLYEQAYQWYTSFDLLGELIDRPNPTPALNVMSAVLTHLTKDCAWPPNRIHLFGFAQGGSVAVESALAWWRQELVGVKMQPKIEAAEKQREEASEKAEEIQSPRALGSITTISGPLLSYPTLDTPCPTPLLIFHRGTLAKGTFTAFSKAFTRVQEIVKSGGKQGQGEESMPRSKDEWEPVMRFWSKVLGRRMGERLYEVMTGTGTV